MKGGGDSEAAVGGGGGGASKQPSASTSRPPKPVSWVYVIEHSFYVLLMVGIFVVQVIPVWTKLYYACKESPRCWRHVRPMPPFNYQYDMADSQWRDLRENAVTILLVAGIFLALSHAIRRMGSATGVAQRRAAFYAVFGVAMLSYLHGACVAWVLLLLGINFVIGKLAGSRVFRVQLSGKHPTTIGVAPILTWTYCIAIMFVIEWYHDWFKFANLSPQLAFLDTYTGVYRWHVGFNMIMLRMISFNLDSYWAAVPPGKLSDRIIRATKSEPAGALSYKVRELTSLPAADYNLVSYVAYLVYVPLHLAGPTITFNAFMSQVHTPQVALSRRQVIQYGLRWLACALFFEFMMYIGPVFAINTSFVFAVLTRPMHTGILGLCSIFWLWMKFLVLWRFFRLWALLDGVEAVENMNRCVFNNYTLSGFWQAWHRSFNRWLVRYIYVPLGGRTRRHFNVFVVFTFVALWHDMTLKLLTWGWLLALFFVPEGVLRPWSARQKWLVNSGWYDQVCALAGTCNVMMLIVANLIGYGVGAHGVETMLRTTFSLSGEGPTFLMYAFVVLYGAVRLMMAVRRREAMVAWKKGQATRHAY